MALSGTRGEGCCKAQEIRIDSFLSFGPVGYLNVTGGEWYKFQ